MPPDHQLSTRISTLENRLTNTTNTLDKLIKDFESLMLKYEGDGARPSILSRIIQLEQFQNTLRWSIGVLYSAVIGLLVTLILKKV